MKVRGNVGNQPEMRFTGKGVPVTNMSLAIAKKAKDGTKETTWVKVTAWNDLAEAVNQKINKGDFVEIDGTFPEVDFWKDDKGNLMMSKTEKNLPMFDITMTAFDVRTMPQRTVSVMEKTYDDEALDLLSEPEAVPV